MSNNVVNTHSQTFFALGGEKESMEGARSGGGGGDGSPGGRGRPGAREGQET
mgnify:CR=1 FL=1